MSLAAALSVLLTTAPSAQLDAAVATDGQARSQMPGETLSGTYADLEVAPELTGHLYADALEGTLRYQPRLLLSSAAPSSSGEPMGVRHAATLGLKWAASPNLAFTLGEDFAYGRSDVYAGGVASATLADDPWRFLESVLPVVPDYLLTSTSGSVSWVMARGVVGWVFGGYFASGATSKLSQALLPMVQGPQLGVGIRDEVSRVDVVGLELYGSTQTVTGATDEENQLVRLSANWDRELAPNAKARATAGVGYVHSKALTITDEQRTRIYPVGGLSVQDDLAERLQRVELRLGAQVGPHLNRANGALAERADLSASARYVLREHLFSQLQAGVARELSGDLLGNQTLGVLTGSIGYQFQGGFAIEGGGQALWDQTTGATAAYTAATGGPFHWVAFAGVSYHSDHLL